MPLPAALRSAVAARGNLRPRAAVSLRVMISLGLIVEVGGVGVVKLIVAATGPAAVAVGAPRAAASGLASALARHRARGEAWFAKPVMRRSSIKIGARTAWTGCGARGKRHDARRTPRRR